MSREHFPEKWAPVFRRKCDQVWNSSGFGRRSVICGLIAAAALIFAGSATLSQEQYPSANVEVVVPFAAGGAVDVTGRVVAQALSKALGAHLRRDQPARRELEYRATSRSRASKPDGYTLLVSSIGLAANAAALQEPALRSAAGSSRRSRSCPTRRSACS